MVHVLTHGLAFLGLAAAVWLTGRLWLRLFPDLGRWRHLAAFCLGFTHWLTGLFLLAVTGWLNVWGLAAVAAPVVLALLPGRVRPVRLPRERPAAAEVAFGAFLAVVLFLTFSLAVSPQVSWDADVYHLTLPRLYLEHGGFRPVEMSVYSNWPLGTELLFGAAMLVGDHMLAKTVHFGFGLLIAYALFLACRSSENGRMAAWLAVILFLANEVVAFELRVAYVDLAYAFFFLAAFLFLHRALEDGDEVRARAFLLLSGLSCGLAAGVKLTGVVGAGILGLLALAHAARHGRPSLAGLVARFALPAGLLWAPWLVKAAWYTGNPFYPFLHGWLGGPDWGPDLAERFGEWQSSIGMGRGPLDYLLLPLRVILFGGRGYPRFDGEISVFWLLVVPLAVVFGRRAALPRRALLAAGLYFAFWALSSQQMRFLIPLLPLLAIAGAAALARLGGRLLSAPGRAAVLLALAAILMLVVYADSVAGSWRNLRAFARVEGDLTETVIPEAHRFIGQNLPAEARILFLNTNLGFFCRREYLADSFFEASQIADWLAGAETAAELRRRLGERGVTHLLFDRRPRVAWPPSLLRMLEDPSRARILFTSSDTRFLVFELR